MTSSRIKMLQRNEHARQEIEERASQKRKIEERRKLVEKDIEMEENDDAKVKKRICKRIWELRN